MQLDVSVLAYDFPHRKTEDILLACAAAGIRPQAVLAAPRKELPRHASWKGFDALPVVECVGTEVLCKRLGFPFHAVEHEDEKAIAGLVGENAVAVIAGARIIPGAVIDCFSNGVINYHPGPIPETSGLDSFYWMIEKGARPCITTHYIDARVDAGSLIEFRDIPLSFQDTPATVMHKLYVAQLQSNAMVLSQLSAGKLPPSSPLDRPAKNPPMNDEMRKSAIAGFDEWLSQRLASEGEARKSIGLENS